MEVKEPDMISWQIVNVMFPPEDQPNLAEEENIEKEE